MWVGTVLMNWIVHWFNICLFSTQFHSPVILSISSPSSLPVSARLITAPASRCSSFDLLIMTTFQCPRLTCARLLISGHQSCFCAPTLHSFTLPLDKSSDLCLFVCDLRLPSVISSRFPIHCWPNIFCVWMKPSLTETQFPHNPPWFVQKAASNCTVWGVTNWTWSNPFRSWKG